MLVLMAMPLSQADTITLLMDEKLPAIASGKLSVDIPFSFVYDGKRSGDFMGLWKKDYAVKSQTNDKEIHLVTYTDPETALEVSIEITFFKKFFAVEWRLCFKNAGSKDTPIIENILPLDAEFVAPGEGNIIFHSLHGSIAESVDYSPQTRSLDVQEEIKVVHYDPAPKGFPFFNVQWQNGGLLGAIGWSGQWQIYVRHGRDRQIVLQAGQQETHLQLYPGESIRTASILLLQWEGKDYLAGHNQWRDLLLSHYVPRINGKAIVPPVSYTDAYARLFNTIANITGKNPLETLANLTRKDLYGKVMFPVDIADSLYAVAAENQLDLLNNIPDIGIENYWIDAGWYERGSGWWGPKYGNWIPKVEFPQGLRPIAEAAHQKGLTFLLWFSPVSSRPDEEFQKKHTGCFLKAPENDDQNSIINYGDTATNGWLAQLFSARIAEYGIDIIRFDGVAPYPVAHWQSTDAGNRQGITEIRWVEGKYALWDKLLKQNPNLIIDNGNWRYTGPDIESMKRSVGCLTRSETAGPCIAHPEWDQMQTAALNLWVPLHSTLLHGVDAYTFRSAATMGVAIGLDIQSEYFPKDQMKSGIAELKSLRPYRTGNYYPLTDINIDRTQWCGWQFDRPDLNSGFAMFFRRPECPSPVFEARLYGIDPNAEYDVTFSKSFEIDAKRRMAGKELVRCGIEINSLPGSMLVRYHKAGCAVKSDNKE
jgi:alpha-galactosidase